MTDPPAEGLATRSGDDMLTDPKLHEFERQLGELAREISGDLEISRLLNGTARLGKYRLLSLLSWRGQAYIFRAIDLQLNRLVAIKIYRNASKSETRKQLLNEARALSRINSSSVIRCIDLANDRQRRFLVLEHVTGVTVSEHTKEHQIGVPQVLSLMEKIASGMIDVHRNGILHLDLKPSNILVLPSGGIKIIDFGLSQTMLDIRADNRCGTIAFMAPERAANEIELIGPRSDVFGLGAVFYYLLTGRPPFDAPTRSQLLQQSLDGQIQSPRSLVSGIPRDVDLLCMSCLEPNVFQRVDSVESLLYSLREISVARKKSRFRNRAFAITGTVLLAAAVTAGVLWR